MPPAAFDRPREAPEPTRAAPRRHDARRLRAVLALALALGVAAFTVDRGLALGLGAEPAWLEDDPQVDWEHYQRFGQRVAGAEWEREHRRAQFPARFGVLLGASTVERGPLPQQLEAKTGYPWLLLGLGGGTGVFGTLRLALGVLENSRLRADRLILGMHPLWLTSAAPSAQAATDPVWFLRHQDAGANFVYGRMQAAREALSLSLGQGTWMAFTPQSDPWHPAPQQSAERRLSPAGFLEHIQANARAGRFDASRYEAAGAHAAELGRVLQRLQALSDHVTVALLPEHATLRARVPAAAERLLVETLQKASATPPEIIDLRASMPDDDFIDGYHLTMTGRRALSDRLSERLTQ